MQVKEIRERKMCRKKLIQVIADGAAGGGTTFVLGLSEDLRETGRFDVEIITAPDSYAERMATEAGFPVHPVNFFRSRLDFGLVRKLRNIIDQSKPDLIHLHGSRCAFHFTFGPLNRLSLPIFYTVHGYHFRKKPWIAKQLSIMAERRISELVDRVIFVSVGDKATAMKHRIACEEKTQVIYNGIEFIEDKKNAIFGEKLADIAFVGRLVPQKNPIFAVEIMASLRHTDITMAIVGGGVLEQKVLLQIERLKLQDKVKMIGAVSREKAIEAMRNSRVCVFPSLWEGLPITPMEAMANGIPVIASDIDGTNEVITHGRTGILIKGFDPLAYGRAIESILRDADLYAEISVNGRELVYKSFRRKTSSAAYAAAYGNALGMNVV